MKMMVVLALLGFFCLETPAAATQQKGVLEFYSREDLETWGGYGEEKLSRVIISGKILCHASRQDKAPYNSYSVSGALVAVICSTNGKTRKIWAKGNTDGYGKFLIELPSHLHAVHDLEKICLVNVFRLPKNSACRQGKHEKIELKSTGNGMCTYMTHNIHLMSKLSKARIYEAPKPDEMVNNLKHNGVRNQPQLVGMAL